MAAERPLLASGSKPAGGDGQAAAGTGTGEYVDGIAGSGRGLFIRKVDWRHWHIVVPGALGFHGRHDYGYVGRADSEAHRNAEQAGTDHSWRERFLPVPGAHYYCTTKR